MAYGFNEDFANYEAQQSQRVIDNRAKAWDLRESDARTGSLNQQTSERARKEAEEMDPVAVKARAKQREHLLNDAEARASWDHAKDLVPFIDKPEDAAKFQQIYKYKRDKAERAGDKAVMDVYDDYRKFTPKQWQDELDSVRVLRDGFQNTPENISANSVTEFGNKSQSKYNQLDQTHAGGIAATAATKLNERQVAAAKTQRINEMIDNATTRKEVEDDRVTAAISESNIYTRDRADKKEDTADLNNQAVVNFKRENDAKIEAARLKAESDAAIATAHDAKDLDVARLKAAKSAAARKSVVKTVIQNNMLDDPKAYIAVNRGNTTAKVNKVLEEQGISVDETSETATAFTAGVMTRVSSVMQQYAGAYEAGHIDDMPPMEQITNDVIKAKIAAGEIQDVPWYQGGGTAYVPSLESMSLSIQAQPNTSTATPTEDVVEDAYKPVGEMSVAEQEDEIVKLEADKAKRAKLEALKAKNQSR